MDFKPAKEATTLKEHSAEWATTFHLVQSHFNDKQKTLLWLSASNPLLGGMSPRDMICTGRFKKLLRFIQTTLDENQR